MPAASSVIHIIIGNNTVDYKVPLNVIRPSLFPWYMRVDLQLRCPHAHTYPTTCLTARQKTTKTM